MSRQQITDQARASALGHILQARALIEGTALGKQSLAWIEDRLVEFAATLTDSRKAKIRRVVNQIDRTGSWEDHDHGPGDHI